MLTNNSGEVAATGTVIEKAEPWCTGVLDELATERFGSQPIMGRTAKNIIPSVRAMFTWADPDYKGPVVYSIRPGHTDKKEEPSWSGFSYLQNWNFPDYTWPQQVVFGAPVVIRSVFNKKWTDRQIELRRLEKEFGLPDRFLSFGTLQTTSGLMLAGLREQNIRVGGFELIFDTETCLAPGARLNLEWSNNGLSCTPWRHDGGAYTDVGGLPQGVLKL